MTDIDLVKQAVEQCGLPHNIAAFHRIRKLVEGQKPTTNSDYAAALKIYGEYASSGVSTIDHFVTFPSWCEERLHSSTNVA